MPFSNFMKKRPVQGQETLSRPCDTYQPPLQGFDQSNGLGVDRNVKPLFPKSVNDIISTPNLFIYFIQFLDIKSAANLAQFLQDVRSFQAAYNTLEARSGFSAIFGGGIGNSESVDSFDSGIMSPNSDLPGSGAKSPVQDDKSNQILAIGIYQSYIAPDSSTEVKILPRDVVQSVINGICTESDENGHQQDIHLDCFEDAYAFVDNYLNKEFFNEFIRSPFYAKYQLDILKTTETELSVVTIKDILMHEELSFHFMEFMEVHGKSGRKLLDFWLNVSPISDGNSQSLTQKDAMVVYERFVSMQAPTPLGFSDKIRCNIEEKICSGTDLVSPSCFEQALNVVLAALSVKFLPQFLDSTLFKKYVLELEKRAGSVSRKTSKLRRNGSTSSLTTVTSEESGLNSSTISNTLLATSSGKRSHGFTNFLDFYNSDPTHLWKRKHNRVTNIGHVNHLGRYTSCVTSPPEDKAAKAIKKKVLSEVPMSRKLTHAMKRLIISETEEQYREDMSWQMAELIVSEVLKITNKRTKYSY